MQDYEIFCSERARYVGDIVAAGPNAFSVTIALAIETTGFESGQLLNMLFGNTSLQDDVALIDVDMPSTFAERFGGPRFGIAGIREITGVHDRPLTCSALKPQGLEPAQYAAIARTFARVSCPFVQTKW